MTTDPPRPADGRSAALIRALAAHPEDMAHLMDELHRPVHDEESLLDLMHRGSAEAVRMISDVHWAGVTAQFAERPFTAAHTDDLVLIVDEGQYGQGDGPCLQAMRTDSSVSMTSEQVAVRWPVLAAAVRAAGVRAFHAEPLHAADRAVGSLNLYSAHPGGLQTPDPDVLTVLTGYLDRGLTDYSAAQPGEPDARRLQEQLRAKFTINQAIGILMAMERVTAEQAGRSLELHAVQQGVTIHDVALDVIRVHIPDIDIGLPDPEPR